MCQLSPVTFHGDTIFCIDYHGEPFTPMKPIVENMGLGWASQSQKLNAYKDRWTVTNIVTVAQDGKERETLCMPVRKLPAFLNSINPKKVKPELRPRIELYQNESDNVLWDYWTKGRAERQPQSIPTTTTPSTAESRKPLRALVSAWAQVSGLPHSALWPQVKAHFQLSRIDDMPEEWLPDALAFVQGKIDAGGNTRAIGVESGLPALPKTDRRAKAFGSIHDIIQAIEVIHTDCVFVNCPHGYKANDHGGAERAAIQAELYKQCMASLRAAQSSLMASSLVGSWA